MTMQAMVKKLEQYGFKVETRYRWVDKTCIFNISKDGFGVTADFVCPENQDSLDMIQRVFIESIMCKWEEDYRRYQDALHGGYTFKIDPKVYTHVTDTDIRRMYPKTYITTAGGDSSFYKRFMNSVYGRFDDGDDGAVGYCKQDVEMTSKIHEIIQQMKKESNTMEIKKVHFNPPLTVVIWKDGTKTFVKASENDVFDPEKGLALAIAKKALGNKYSYIDEIKKHLPKKEEE